MSLAEDEYQTKIEIFKLFTNKLFLIFSLISIKLCEIIAELNRRLVEENAREEMDQDVFMRKYGSYSSKYDAESAKVDQLKSLRTERLQKAEAVSAFMFEIHEQDRFIEDFSEKLWLTTIDTVTVHHDGRMVFRFKNGMEVTK